jgi:IclR family transcriptional regulator, mhp operon transcriptional activator
VRTLTAGFHSEPTAIEIAAPILKALTARHKWPMTLTVLDDMAAVVRYSTIPSSPLSLLHSTVGLRHSLVSRALGRAILAFCAPDERDAILDQLAQSTQPEDQAARERDRFVALLDEIRAQGYAMRDVLGSIGLTWFSSTHKPQEAVRRYLGGLQEAATEISRRLSE